METSEIIILILTSSLVTAVLTSAVSWYLQKDNYRKDYYKKLLDKRLDAYESVEQFSSMFAENIQFEDGRVCQSIFAQGKHHYDNCLTKIYIASQKSFWLSNDMSIKIMELNAYLLHHIEHNIDYSKDTSSQLLELGIKYRQIMKGMRNEIDLILYKDLALLHDIRKFTKVKQIKDEHDGVPIYHK